eukprot:947476_1
MINNALGASHYGSSATSVLSFVTIPKPNPESLSRTELIVKVEYSELNPVDHHKLKGPANKPAGTEIPNAPLIVGFGGSGIVESINADIADDKTKELLGKKVIFIANPSKSGSYAEYIVCDRRVVAEIPEGKHMTLKNAASVPVAGCTALESLAKVGFPITVSSPSASSPATNNNTRKRLLIIGGAGGVGSWTTQLARSCYPDLEIICTASSPSSSEWCKKMGADRTLSHDPDDIMKSLGGGPKGSIDGIICLAEPTPALFNALSEVLRPYGKICLVVAGAGIKSLDLGFIFFKCGTVTTQTVFSSIRDGYHLDQSGGMEIILRFMKDGNVKAPFEGNRSSILDEEMKDTTSSTDNWKEAIEKGGLIDKVGSGHCRGKLVMKIGSDKVE